MEKRLNAEFLLPEAIIHHIQSYLDGKQAAQTTILSNSFYTAWLTRPNLDFDQRVFRHRGDVFSEFARKTLQRYQDLNLKIKSFKLYWEKDSSPLAYELIPKAIKCGATDLDLKLPSSFRSFVLPHDVLASETLTRLSVFGCQIEDVEKVNCSKLKSLHLRYVYLEGDMICDVLSSCPLIEDLVLTDCKRLDKVNDFSTKERMLALDPFFKLHKLSCLFLQKVKIAKSFFVDLSYRSPCLKDLSVHNCSGFKEIRIHSLLLESISVKHKTELKAHFDVPKVRKFKFSCSCPTSLPCLSFKTASNKWVSDLSLSCETPSALWFLHLNKLLTNLSSSQINLSLGLYCGKKRFDYTGEIEVLPIVQSLRLNASLVTCSSAIWDGIFWSCRPVSIIIEQWLAKSLWDELAERANCELTELTCKRLKEEVSRLHPYLEELKEVCLFELRSLSQEWQPLPWKTFLGASCRETDRTICFRMEWES